jgi:hypothetical protein
MMRPVDCGWSAPARIVPVKGGTKMMAQVVGPIGSGVPSLVAPVAGVTTLVVVCLAFLIGSVLLIALARRRQA